MRRSHMWFTWFLWTLAFGPTTFAGAAPAPKHSGAASSASWFCREFETVAFRTSGDANTAQQGGASHAVQQCIELINSGVSQRRFTYRKDAARRCIDTQTGCDDVLSGLQSAGKACESSLDCQKPLVCIGPRGGAPGNCSKPLAAGLNCDDEVGAGRFFALALSKRSVCGVGMHCAAQSGGVQICVPGT